MPTSAQAVAAPPADRLTAPEPVRAATAAAGVAARPRLAAWERVGWAGVLLVAALLRLVGLDRQGYENTFYAAAVQSMLSGWHAFFFASLDPGGFVSVDKPPLGLWLQAASARLLGFDGVALALPQALAGIAAVAVTGWLVRRTWGPAAGLLAALLLAVTPITVVTDRNNTPDALVVLAMLLAGWAGLLAAERGDRRWLLLAMTAIGLGFNVKMLQAYLVLPAVALVWLLTATLGRRRRVGDLLLGGAVLLAASLAWAAAVDLTPAANRPYIGSSGTNSALSLALGYNGLGRLAKVVGANLGTVTVLGLRLDLAEAPGFIAGIGEPGPLRLWQDNVGGQASWFLAPALLGLMLATGVLWRTWRADRATGAERVVSDRGRSVLFWAIWLLTTVGFFSKADFFHPYYLVSLGPPAAAGAAIGAAVAWEEWQRGGWRRLWLPALVLAGAASQAAIAVESGADERLLVVPAIAAAAVAGVLAIRAWPARTTAGLAAAAIALLLVAPATWATRSVAAGAGGAWIPEARAGAMGFGGPGGLQGGRGGGPGGFPGGGSGGGPGSASGFGGAEMAAFRGFAGMMTASGANWNRLDPGLVAYLTQHHVGETYLAATETATNASILMLATGQGALPLGGYQGWDKVIDAAGLSKMVAGGEVRYFVLGPAGSSAGWPGSRDSNLNDDLTAWVASSCAEVPASTWQSASAAAAPGDREPEFGQGTPEVRLFDCAGAGQSTSTENGNDGRPTAANVLPGMAQKSALPGQASLPTVPTPTGPPTRLTTTA